jgi:phosphoglycolate phosphatase
MMARGRKMVRGRKLAIFDMDGTIVNFTIDSKGARSDAIQFLNATLQIPEGVLDTRLTTTETMAKARQHVLASGKPEPDWTAIRTSIYKIIEAYEDKAAEISTPIPGIGEVLAGLKTLKANRVQMAICTFNSTRNAILVLQRTGLAKFFDTIVGRDKVPDKTKPNPAHGNYILDELGFTPGDTCMIGDHPFDIEMAVAMGIKGIGITSERHPPSDFARFPNIAIVSDKEYHLLGQAIKNALGIM